MQTEKLRKLGNETTIYYITAYKSRFALSKRRKGWYQTRYNVTTALQKQSRDTSDGCLTLIMVSEAKQLKKERRRATRAASGDY